MASLVRAGGLALVQNVSGLVFGIGTYAMLARLLPKEDMGTWAAYMTLVSLLEVARNGLVQNAKINFLQQYSDHEPEVIKASLVINLGVSVLMASVLLATGLPLAAYWNAPVVQQLLWSYALTSLVLVPFSQANVLQQARMNFGWVAVGNITRTAGLFLLVGWYFIQGSTPQLATLANAQLVIALVAALVAIYGVKGQYELAKGLQWQWVKRLLHFGKYVFGTNLSAVFYTSIDQLLMPNFLPKQALAGYNAAVRINTLAEVPILTLASVIYPYKVQLMNRDGEAASYEIFYKSVGAVTGLLLPVVLASWLFPELILTIIAGPKYADAAPLLQVLATGVLFQPMLRQFGTQMDSSGRPHLNFLAAFGMAVLNTGLNYWAIQQFGTTGAAWSTLGTQFTFAVVAAILLNIHFGLNMLKVIPHLGMSYVLSWQLAMKVLRR